MNTLISADNTWALLSIMCVSVAIAIWLEQKYAWAAKISGAILALHCMAALESCNGRYGLCAIAGAGGTGTALIMERM